MSFSDVYVLVNLMIRTIKKQNLLTNSFSKIFQQKSKSNKRFCWSSDQSNCFSPITVIDYQSQNKSYKLFFFFFKLSLVSVLSHLRTSQYLCAGGGLALLYDSALWCHTFLLLSPQTTGSHTHNDAHTDECGLNGCMCYKKHSKKQNR